MSYKVIQSWQDDELSLNQGDTVYVLDQKPAQGLVYFKRQNVEGWVPSSRLSPTPSPSSKQAPFVLSGIYFWVFYVFEPISVFCGAASIWFFDTAWFFHSLVPAPGTQPEKLNDRTKIAVWQLGNCYFLLGLVGVFLYPAVRKALPGQLRAQEIIIGAVLTALSIADITHLLVTMIGLPPDMMFDIQSWNATTHGNTTVAIVLFSIRCAWFLGIGRETAKKQKAH